MFLLSDWLFFLASLLYTVFPYYSYNPGPDTVSPIDIWAAAEYRLADRRCFVVCR